MDNGI